MATLHDAITSLELHAYPANHLHHAASAQVQPLCQCTDCSSATLDALADDLHKAYQQLAGLSLDPSSGRVDDHRVYRSDDVHSRFIEQQLAHHADEAGGEKQAEETFELKWTKEESFSMVVGAMNMAANKGKNPSDLARFSKRITAPWDEEDWRQLKAEFRRTLKVAAKVRA